MTAEQAENYEYTLGVDGCASIHRCLETEPGFYDQEECISRLEELGEEQVLSLTPPDDVTTETRIILQTARIYSGVPWKVLGWRSAVGLHCKFNRCAV